MVKTQIYNYKNSINILNCYNFGIVLGIYSHLHVYTI